MDSSVQSEKEHTRLLFPIQDALQSMAAHKNLSVAIAFIYLRRVDALGVPRARGDTKRFRKAIEKGLGSGKVSLPVSKRRIAAAGIDFACFAEAMKLAISDEELDACATMFEAAVASAATRAIEFTSKAHGRYLNANAHEILEEHRASRSEFLARLKQIWEPALDMFDALVGIAREVGQTAIAFVAASSDDEVWSHKDEAAVHLFGRACQIADEIFVLLANGFADGAQARWRSLHEIQVVISVLHKGDEELSKRYLEHHDIDLYNEAKITLSSGNTVVQGITEEQFEEIQHVRGELVTRYGKDFDAPYGWASQLLGFKATRFSDIEQRAGAVYLRPFYKSASANVHASSRGTFTRLGTLEPSDGALAGGSIFGLSRPAIGAAHSLVLAAITIATHARSPDALAKAMAMERFSRDLGRKFDRAERASHGPRK